jgi:hypothetical protein
MLQALKDMEVDDTELVPIPDVDGETLKKALEYCAARAPRDDAYAASVPRRLLFKLIHFASKWNCEPLARVLSRKVVHTTMEECDSVGALKRAFDVSGEFGAAEREGAAVHEPALIRRLTRDAFLWNREYFLSMQLLTFEQSRREPSVLGTRRHMQGAQDEGRR